MNALTSHADLAFDTARVSRPSTVAPRTNGVFGLVRWVLDMPRRRAVINELQSLSDHELSDIGLSRDEVGRVFDRGFSAQRQAV